VGIRGWANNYCHASLERDYGRITLGRCELNRRQYDAGILNSRKKIKQKLDGLRLSSTRFAVPTRQKLHDVVASTSVI